MSFLFVDHEHPIWNNAEIVVIDAEIEVIKCNLEQSLGEEFELEEIPVNLFALWSDNEKACAMLQKWMIKKSFKC